MTLMPPSTVSVRGAAAPGAEREHAFDLLRGLCIISMVVSHLSSGSLLDRVTHAPGWVDGAVGFVFISGLVLGLVHRRTVERSGLGTALRRVLRRVRVIYAANAAITLLALAVGTYLPAHSVMPSAHRYGWEMSLMRVLVVAVNPAYSVLGLYIFLMLGALGALTLLARRRTGLLVSLSVVVYAVARLAHLDTSLPGHGNVAAFHVAGWQLLYVLGMVVGWHWREPRVKRVVLHPGLQLPALVAVVALTCLFHVTGRGLLGTVASARLSSYFDKPTLAPGVLVFALAALTVGYRVATWALRSPAARWFASVATVGRHSLDAYVIAMFTTIVVPAMVRFPESGWFAQALASAVLVAAYLWARLRDGGRTRRPLARAAGDRPGGAPRTSDGLAVQRPRPEQRGRAGAASIVSKEGADQVSPDRDGRSAARRA